MNRSRKDLTQSRKGKKQKIICLIFLCVLAPWRENILLIRLFADNVSQNMVFTQRREVAEI